MKKFLALLLALCMVFSLMACNGETEDEAAGMGDVDFNAGQDSDIVNKDELPHYKFAFSYATFSDKLGTQFKDCLQYLGDAYNVEMVFFEAGSGDDRVTNIESILAAGDIDGIITVGGTPAMVAVAEKYGVPYVMACGFPSLEEEIKGVASYDNFLGGVVDDDVWAGTRCIEALYEAGVRNFTFSGLTEGFVKSHDDRRDAMRAVVASHDDMNLLAENYTLAEFANDITSYHASFGSQIEGMAFSCMSDAVYQGLETEGLTDGSVKISGVDISSQTGIYFKNGVQVWTCGGQYATTMVAWAILYNYVNDGWRVIEDTSTPMLRPYLEITSYEDYEEYVKYVEGSLPTYSVDEIAQLLKAFNPDVTVDTYEQYAEDYTLAKIIERHADLIDAVG